jgi:transcriptional regulator with XRE-family HTH domain
MTGAELRAIREKLGMTQEAFGRALDYKGPNVGKIISTLERGAQPVPRLMQLALGGLPGAALWRLVEAHPEAFLHALALAEASSLRDDAIAAVALLDGGRLIGAKERADCERRIAAYEAILEASQLIYKTRELFS